MDYFYDNMKKILGDEFDGFVKSLSTEKYNGIRANTLKINRDELREILDFECEKIPWCEDGLLYTNARPSKNPLYHAGLYYLQEPSAMLPIGIMNIEKDDIVLDLCAAPGGKTTHIAAKLKGTGLLVSNDISATRGKAIVKNIELFGIKNSVITCEAPQKLASKFKKFFDKILVDAPCSGEGMFKSNQEVLKSYNQDSNNYYSALQKEILGCARQMLKDGGEIVYSTCTFSPLENEAVINDFLDRNKDFEIVELEHDELGISNGLGNISECARIWPHKSKGEGHFAARLKHIGERKASEGNFTKHKLPKNIDNYFEFAQNYFNGVHFDNICAIENKLYSVCEHMLDFSGIRVLRGDFYLGEIKTKRFEPSQALAMYLKRNEFKNTIELCERDAIRYLEGESFEVEADEGFNLVCIKNYPLGFGKVVNGRLKNKYSKGWRM